MKRGREEVEGVRMRGGREREEEVWVSEDHQKREEKREESGRTEGTSPWNSDLLPPG